MGFGIHLQPPLSSISASSSSSLQRASLISVSHGIHRGVCARHWPSPSVALHRFGSFSSVCSVINADADFEHEVTEVKAPDDLPFLPSCYSIQVVHLHRETVLSEEVQDALGCTPVHAAGLYALYACSLAGNLVEQLWNLIWPAAVALLHPSFLPVATVSFFTKLAVFVGGPLMGELMDFFPRVPAYNFINLVQVIAQLLSATAIIHGLQSNTTSASSVLLQPWFFILVLSMAVERLSSLTLGIAIERDWVVVLAGSHRPVALAGANAILGRIDLLCEIAGAVIFGLMLSKYDVSTCLKLTVGLILCTLPLVALLVVVTNKLSSSVLDNSKISCMSEWPHGPGNLVGKGFGAIRHGWFEYKKHPVLPASFAYVLLYFNIALTPGGLMTAFLTQLGLDAYTIGGFNVLCAFMGVVATFISARLVKELGVLKAGAAGLILQATLLTLAVAVYLSGFLPQRTPLFLFLSLIVLSRLGHMSYDILGAQILQIGVPSNKANLLGITEVSVASLAEFVVLGAAIIANDSYFGILVMLSVTSVLGAALMFCWWLGNPTDEQKKLLF